MFGHCLLLLLFYFFLLVLLYLSFFFFLLLIWTLGSILLLFSLSEQITADLSHAEMIFKKFIVCRIFFFLFREELTFLLQISVKKKKERKTRKLKNYSQFAFIKFFFLFFQLWDPQKSIELLNSSSLGCSFLLFVSFNIEFLNYIGSKRYHF